ncbi:MAG: GNAT family N-acetyltransferase [Oscillospiraceae bacterium]|nr:GNAT family N-acetyltransferase [Oscillospiraceae bacterium]
MNYFFVNADQNKYAIYYSVYSIPDIFALLNWNEMLGRIDDRKCFFVLDCEKIIGGFTLTGNELCYIFTVPPFSDRTLLWKHILKYASDNCVGKEIVLKFIPEEDKVILTDGFNAKIICTERRMLRPTEKISVKPPDNFYFTIPDENDKQEIIQTVYEAHAAGYTSTVWQPDKNEIKEAINRRYDSFTQTKTLYMSTLVKYNGSNEIAGVCIAGIYPDSMNNFSTIHQVSVRPQFRRLGIAESMMLNSINKASSVSPVITLGVMVGNPAELLYNKIGFFGGLKYSELSYMG